MLLQQIGNGRLIEGDRPDNIARRHGAKLGPVDGNVLVHLTDGHQVPHKAFIGGGSDGRPQPTEHRLLVGLDPLLVGLVVVRDKELPRLRVLQELIIHDIVETSGVFDDERAARLDELPILLGQPHKVYHFRKPRSPVRSVIHASLLHSQLAWLDASQGSRWERVETDDARASRADGTRCMEAVSILATGQWPRTAPETNS